MGMANEIRKNPLRVGMYDIEKTIGKGNFAVVKLAHHRTTKSQVGFVILGRNYPRIQMSSIPLLT